ncbi:MAG TPA: serine protease [Thermoguttaceae bacterium]|nr:serine protease [Thermoguttaceae bacterium]
MNRSLFGLLLYWIVAVLAIVLITLWAAGLATASIADCIDATCRITAKDGGRGTGCAFERSQGYVYVLTAAHVVGDSQTVQCEFWRAGHQSSPLPATVIQRSPEADAAVVAVPESAFGGLVPKTIPVGPRDFVVRPGETVTSVGCANGTWSTGFRGHALGYEGSDLHFVPTPANGRSGSAIFDAEGRVIVGLLRARTGDDTQGIATSLQTLHAALAGQSQSEIRNPKSLNVPGVRARRLVAGIISTACCPIHNIASTSRGAGRPTTRAAAIRGPPCRRHLLQRRCRRSIWARPIRDWTGSPSYWKQPPRRLAVLRCRIQPVATRPARPSRRPRRRRPRRWPRSRRSRASSASSSTR